MSADGESINELHMERKKKKKNQESLQEPFFWLVESEALSGYLKAYFSEKLTFNSCK